MRGPVPEAGSVAALSGSPGASLLSQSCSKAVSFLKNGFNQSHGPQMGFVFQNRDAKRRVQLAESGVGDTEVTKA